MKTKAKQNSKSNQGGRRPMDANKSNKNSAVNSKSAENGNRSASRSKSEESSHSKRDN